MVDVGQKISAILEAQRDCYRAMLRAVEEQTLCIETMNVGGLTAGASETRALMRKIRDLETELRPFRQSWQNLGLDRPVPEKRSIDNLIADIRAQIESIQKVKDKNTALLKQSMVCVRKQMTGVKERSHASRAYQKHPPQRSQARFIDKSN